MAVGGAYIAFNNRLTILETKNDVEPPKESSHTDSERLAVIETELKNLTDEVRKHNSIIERTFKLEARVDSIEHRL